MLTIILFIVSLLIGILALVFLIIGLVNKNRQKTISGAVILGAALILFFYTVANLMEAYFDFVGRMMQKSLEYEKNNHYTSHPGDVEEDFVLSAGDFSDTLYEADSSIFLLHGIEEVKVSGNNIALAFYKPESFGLCIFKEISLYNNKQLNIIMSNECAHDHPDKVEVYNSGDVQTNSSSFVQIQPANDGQSEIQYILRKELNPGDSHYILLKYE